MKAIIAITSTAFATAAAAHPGHGASTGHVHWEIAALIVVFALGGVAVWKSRS